jgi:hypothetical protein
MCNNRDSLWSICWETATTCPPHARRSLPTVIFVLGFGLSMVGSKLSKTWGYNEVEPDWFLSIFFNGFGSLVILVCAVWLVDALWLCWLLLVGKKGAAQNWWWKRSLEGDYNAIAGQTDLNVITDSISNAKSMQLDEERRSAKKRAALILILYAWWTAWAAGKQLIM